MPAYTIPTPDEVHDPEARAALDAIKKQVGRIPNLYAYEAHSPRAFVTNLPFAQAVETAHFTAREAQAVYLAASEANECTYCLAAHTALAKRAGFTEEETLGLRVGASADARLAVLTRLTRRFVDTKGRPEPALLDAFFEAGYTQAHLVDLVGLISVKTFTTYLHNATGIAVDFPAARALPAGYAEEAELVA